MSDLDRRMRRVGVALFFFGVLFAGSLTGLSLRTAVTQVFPIRPLALEIAAAAGAVGLLVTTLAGWIADRGALRNQELALLERTNAITLARRDLEAEQTQQALTLKLEEQQIENELAVLDERVKIRKLEDDIRLGELARQRREDEAGS